MRKYSSDELEGIISRMNLFEKIYYYFYYYFNCVWVFLTQGKQPLVDKLTIFIRTFFFVDLRTLLYVYNECSLI